MPIFCQLEKINSREIVYYQVTYHEKTVGSTLICFTQKQKVYIVQKICRLCRKTILKIVTFKVSANI